MTFILPFSKIDKNSAALAGGKGASLGEMAGAGIPVPPGFVVAAGAFDEFLRQSDINVEIDAVLDAINYEDMKSVDEASRKISSLIHLNKMPKSLAAEILERFKKLNCDYVAVRSSATAEDSSIASWAGELDTFLNTTEKNLFQNIKKCWASLFTPRAIFYACEKGLYRRRGDVVSPTEGALLCGVSVAVVVQKMVQSEISGICFTVHPVTKDYEQMIIEAGWGLGEAIVSGAITPDSYVIDKEDMSILDINISAQQQMIVRVARDKQQTTSAGVETVEVPKEKQDKQKLLGSKIIELAELCVKIEKHYGFPCDIEWAIEKDKIYITQSRPITTL